MQSLSWQEQLSGAIRQPDELLDYVGLRADSIGYSEKAIKQFSIRVPHVFADRIQRNMPDDPILRQVFPYRAEDEKHPAYVNDPLAESLYQPVKGLLHKYRSRVLFITTGACAVHCRYCFRRHFPYQGSLATGKYIQQGLDYIKNDNSIDEIILSGGDPLTLSDHRLYEICRLIADIKHIKRIRFHTRIPVVLPDRISTGLLEKIILSGKTIIFVLHINHANEIDAAVVNKIKLLHQFNIMLLNQSVLLRGVNDSCEVLIKLSERLIENQLSPYYLHLLDPVAGASHYDVPLPVARGLIQEMQSSVSGYMVPKLVKEEIGRESKTIDEAWRANAKPRNPR